MRTTPLDLLYVLVVGLLATLALLILLGPVLVVLITSFTSSAALRFPPPGLSLQWYAELFDPVRSGHIHTAALNSLKVAGVATVVGAVLAVLAALGLARSKQASARALEAGFMAPLILPMLAYGLAALIFSTMVGLRPSLTLLVIGHLVVITPFIFRTSLASLTQLEPALLECSASLGASRIYGFRRITLPIIMPGILAGAFLAFIASLDNVPVSLFLSSARTDMLPVRMWGMIESTLDVRVAAISGILILVVVILMVMMERLVGFTRRMGA
jgi:putative spermidine/putrescine transport system permease protein